VFITFSVERGQCGGNNRGPEPRVAFANPQISVPQEPVRSDRLRLGRPLQLRLHLLAAESPSTGAATPLQIRNRNRAGATLRLPELRQFTLTIRTNHWIGARFLFTG